MGECYSKISHKLNVKIDRWAAEYGTAATMAGLPIWERAWLI